MPAIEFALPLDWSGHGLASAICSVSVAVLFARRDSIYKSLASTDVYDADRDALTFAGGAPVVAHPPCRSWGRLAHMANPRPGEKELAPWAVQKVRECGGVLEHPIASKLWPACNLPEPGRQDEHGGYTIEVQQYWWGHRAEKWTRLYICGCDVKDLPAVPHRTGRPDRVVSTGHGLRIGHPNFRTRCTDREREATPPKFAEWLLAVARLCKPNNQVQPTKAMKSEETHTPTAGWLARLVRLFGWKDKPGPVWRGECECCGKDVTADYVPDGAVLCFGCYIGVTVEAKQRAEDRRQIDLYKKAIREIEAENKTNKVL